MSTKDWVYQKDDNYGLFQEMTLETVNDNPATLSITNPSGFKVEFEANVQGRNVGTLTAKIPAEIFDQIAIAWCKRRKLHGALGGPVGLEWGSPDSPYEV